MDRRSLFKNAFALFGIPWGVIEGASLTQAIVLPDSISSTESDLADSPIPPAWLEDWLRLPMQPLVTAGDLEANVNPHIREIALGILSRPDGGEPFGFRYHGGSNPGSARSVLPVLLFRKIDPAVSVGKTCDGATTFSPLYLLAQCLTRGEARTFRLDRMEIV